jgi:hypothetical protein
MIKSFLALLLWLGFSGSGSTESRTYYLAAEEVLWDYAPSYPMHHSEFSGAEKVFVEGNRADRIGRQYY